MNQDESQEPAARPEPESQPAPAAGAPSGPPQENRFRGRSRGRGRGRRDGRSGGDRNNNNRGPRDDRPPSPDGNPGQQRGGEHRRPTGSIGEAIDQVEHIRMELNKVLAEINEVMEILEVADREKTASEQEIDKLRESLRSLHRDPGAGYPRPYRNFSPPRQQPAVSEPSPAADADPGERSEDSDD